eukprot:g3114.t1
MGVPRCEDAERKHIQHHSNRQQTVQLPLGSTSTRMSTAAITAGARLPGSTENDIDALRALALMQAKRKELDWGPEDGVFITLANTQRYAMPRNGDRSKEAQAVWDELLQHRLSRLPRADEPPGGEEEEDVLVAIEDTEVDAGGGDAGDGGMTIRGRLLTGAGGAKGDPNRVDEMGSTPVTLAASRGRVASIRVLGEHGADLDFQDQKGWSAAHCAVLGGGGYPAVLRLLFNMGAALDLRDRAGATPAHHAASLGKLGCLRFLALAAAGTLCARAADGSTPLHIAARAGSDRAVQFLLRFGADANARDRYGDSAAHKAARASKEEALLALQRGGADLHAANAEGDSASMLARDVGLCTLPADAREIRAVHYSDDPAPGAGGAGRGAGHCTPDPAHAGAGPGPAGAAGDGAIWPRPLWATDKRASGRGRAGVGVGGGQRGRGREHEQR